MYNDYQNHTAKEEESGRVLEFLKEIVGMPFDHDNPSYYGNPNKLDQDTATLCHWCSTHDVSNMSLELQLWWQQHQRADAAREVEAQRRAETERLRQQAIGKLTDEELRAIGVRR